MTATDTTTLALRPTAVAATVSQTQLREAMNRAFADYAVPMQLDRKAFFLMTRIRGFSRRASRVVWIDGALAAFWFVAVRDRRAYLVASGTAPEHRCRGLFRALGEETIAALGSAGCESLSCEVLEQNAGARRLYRALGFSETRDLDCYALPTRDRPPLAAPVVTEGDGLPEGARTLWTTEPSWQNTAEALRAAGPHATILESHDAAGLAAYAAFIPSQGVLAQVAVRPDRRREGLATTLLAAAEERLDVARWRVLNVDRRDEAARAFLLGAGATPTVSQKELRLML